MSTAQVVNSLVASPASRITPMRGGSVATSYQSVEALDTHLAARGRDDFRRFDDMEDFEATRPQFRQNYSHDYAVRFSGVFLSQEVGTTMVQAQAAFSRAAAPTLAASQAERNIAQYEFNQSLMGVPEVTTTTGVMH